MQARWQGPIETLPRRLLFLPFFLGPLACGRLVLDDVDSGRALSAAPDASMFDAQATRDARANTSVDARSDAFAIDPYCDPNPPAPDPRCPNPQPTPGSACSTRGVVCLYPESNDPSALAWMTCAGDTYPAWSASGVGCRYDCGAYVDAGANTPIATTQPCAMRTAVDCAPRWFETRQAVLDNELLQIESKCGAFSEDDIYWMFLDTEGCATSVVGKVGSIAACIVGELARVRFTCNRACGVGAFSTLPR